MRLSGRVAIAVVAATAAAGAGALLLAQHADRSHVAPSVATGTPISGEEKQPLAIDRTTKVAVGSFKLRGGGRRDVFTARTADGKSCLVDEDAAGGSGATCSDGDLFAGRRAAFSVASEGRPGAFTELLVTGVVAPAVRSASLVLTDGSAIELGLTRERGFLRESTSDELRARIYPAAIRLFGASGGLLETVTFPPPD